MDRVQQISAELVQLYQAQLDIWEPGKLRQAPPADTISFSVFLTENQPNDARIPPPALGD